MRKVAYSKDAFKALRRMPANISALIISKINQFAVDPALLGNNLKPLKNRPGEFRFSGRRLAGDHDRRRRRDQNRAARLRL